MTWFFFYSKPDLQVTDLLIAWPNIGLYMSLQKLTIFLYYCYNLTICVYACTKTYSQSTVQETVSDEKLFLTLFSLKYISSTKECLRNFEANRLLQCHTSCGNHFFKLLREFVIDLYWSRTAEHQGNNQFTQMSIQIQTEHRIVFCDFPGHTHYSNNRPDQTIQRE